MTELLSQKYRSFFIEGQQLRVDAGEPVTAHLKANKVPEEVLPLLPYAEFWGISDDSYRIELIKRAPLEVWKDFQEAVSKHKSALLDWLAGPEANSAPTPEYVAFSFMLQAFDWPRS